MFIEKKTYLNISLSKQNYNMWLLFYNSLTLYCVKFIFLSCILCNVLFVFFFVKCYKIKTHFNTCQCNFPILSKKCWKILLFFDLIITKNIIFVVFVILVLLFMIWLLNYKMMQTFKNKNYVINTDIINLISYC